MFLSLAFFLFFLALVLGPGHISFIGSGFTVKVCFLGSGFKAKVFISLALVSDPGCVSFTGSGVRVRVGFFGWPFPLQVVHTYLFFQRMKCVVHFCHQFEKILEKSQIDRL